MKKVILLIAVALILVWLGVSIFARIGKEPSASVAPYVIYTYSRMFYAEQVTGTPPDITVTGYWEQRGDKWIRIEGQLKFNKNVGMVTVNRR